MRRGCVAIRECNGRDRQRFVAGPRARVMAYLVKTPVLTENKICGMRMEEGGCTGRQRFIMQARKAQARAQSRRRIEARTSLLIMVFDLINGVATLVSEGPGAR